MGFSTWKWLLLGVACGQPCSQSENCEDQTALLQSHLASHKSATLQATTFPSVSQLMDPAGRKQALVQLEATAIELVQTRRSSEDDPNGVSAICGVVKNVLQDEVNPIIQSNKDSDDTLLTNTYNTETAAVTDSFDTKKLRIENANTHASTLTNSTSHCVAVEEALCEACAVCEVSCYNETEDCDNWFQYVKGNYSLLLIKVTPGAECALDDEGNAIVSISPDASTNETNLQWHEGLHTDLENVWSSYNWTYWEWKACARTETEKCSKCWCPGSFNETHGPMTVATDGEEYVMNETCPCSQLTEAHSQCTSINDGRAEYECQQQNMQAADVLSYKNTHSTRKDLYEDVVAMVLVREVDRKKEWETIQHIICLLDLLIYDSDNRSNYNESAYDGWVNETVNSTVIQNCRHYVNTTFLDHIYSVFPPESPLPDASVPCTYTFSEAVKVCDELGDWNNSTDNCTCHVYTAQQENSSTFPDSWGPFFTLDPNLENSELSFTPVDATPAGRTGWQLEIDGQTYSGKLSSWTLEDEAFSAFAYPADCLTADPACNSDDFASHLRPFLSDGAIIRSSLGENAGEVVNEVRQLFRLHGVRLTDVVPQDFKLVVKQASEPSGCTAEQWQIPVPSTISAPGATSWRYCAGVFSFEIVVDGVHTTVHFEEE